MKYFNNFDRYNLLEYLNSEDSFLYQYLNKSEEEKYNDLAYHYPYIFLQFFEENEYEIEEGLSDEEFSELKELIETEGEDAEDHDYLDLIFHNKDLMEEYGRYVEDSLVNGSDQSSLTSHFFFSNPKIIKKQWLVHLTDYASEIWQNGFTHGTESVEDLGLTTYNTHTSKERGGYNFAFTPYSFDKYGSSGNRKHNFRYGDEAILFKSSGVEAYHRGDEEHQVIFYGKYATDIIWMEYGEIEHGDNVGGECWFIESRKTGKRLVEKDKVGDLVKWVETNYDQYRNHL
jgi:hypothetical protein